MKFPISWLKRHLETDATIEAIDEALTMIGIEVESINDPGAKLSAFTVARIIEAKQHPNADRLRVCQVDTVDGVKEIVCGAPNARAGLVTVYAPLGTYIPGSGITLEARPVRGVVSNGMLCSAAELEVAEESDGILELDASLKVGTLAAVALDLNDPVIDVEVTPNRPDWLGVAGIARDLAAKGVGRFIDSPNPVPAIKGTFKSPIRIEIDAPEACMLFAGRVVRGVSNKPSPAWLQALLRAVGLRPISALVDITNFLSLDRARPLHVYDVSKIDGGVIRARLGKRGEKIEALDGKTYDVGEEMCVIADAKSALGFGGVMGGMSSGVTEETTDVFIESAWFHALRTFQTGRTTGIVSDARYRFERGIDPDFTVPGLELATRMVLDLCGGEASEIVVVGPEPSKPSPVAFDASRVEKATGMAVPAAEVARILTSLGFGVKTGKGSAMTVAPPSWRRDVVEAADLVEEVARIHGFENLPETPLAPLAGRTPLAVSLLQNRGRIARRALAAQGYSEAVTWSFMKKSDAALFGGGANAATLVLANPIAADLDCMRPSALANLLQAAQRNANMGHGNTAFFEVGPTYQGDGPKDQSLVAAAVRQPSPERTWAGQTKVDAYTMKADAIAVLEALGVATLNLMTMGPDGTHWHPGQSATLRMGPKVILAAFGTIHPAVLKALGVDGPAYGLEVYLDAIPVSRSKSKARPAFAKQDLMPLSRDFAFLVPEVTEAQILTRAIAGADKELITAVSIFDVYRGKGVEDGHKSLAVEVVLQPIKATLSDSEIQSVSNKIIAAAAKVGAILRG
jgi:phenylalanyl-tRNA synthetase beta chain